ncbi:MAG: PQQ-binding-like beta-propeller repeat protein [Sphingomonadales bacterium]|nr:PQQ-binding-like beta-propeller repeat protein [Sphingomonadales bacterium]
MTTDRFTRSTPRIAMTVLAAVGVALAGCSHSPLGGKKRPTTPTLGNRIPILSRVESGATVATDLSTVSVILPPAETNADWGQPGGNAGKSYGHLAIGDAPAKAWSVSIAGSSTHRRLAAAPVIGGGTLFAMDTEGVLHAFDAKSGAQKWTASFKVNGKGASTVFGGGASYLDGKVFVTTGFGEVAAVDAQTGKTLWSQHPAGPMRGSPTLAFGSVFAMTQNNEIHALSATDGTELWQESGSLGEQGVFGVAAPAAGQGTVIAGYSTGELIAYRYENGRTLWSDALARTSLSTSVGVLTDIDADPIIDHGRVYALGQGGRMAAYELVSGQRIWELNLAGISTPAVAGDWIFTLTDDSKLLCIARSSGKVRWSTQLAKFENEKKKKGPIFWTGPVLAGNRLWIANTRGTVYAASVTDGTVGEFARVGSPVSLAPVVAGGTLYVLDDGGKITAWR